MVGARYFLLEAFGLVGVSKTTTGGELPGGALHKPSVRGIFNLKPSPHRPHIAFHRLPSSALST